MFGPYRSYRFEGPLRLLSPELEELGSTAGRLVVSRMARGFGSFIRYDVARAFRDNAPRSHGHRETVKDILNDIERSEGRGSRVRYFAARATDSTGETARDTFGVARVEEIIGARKSWLSRDREPSTLRLDIHVPEPAQGARRTAESSDDIYRTNVIKDALAYIALEGFDHRLEVSQVQDDSGEPRVIGSAREIRKVARINSPVLAELRSPHAVTA